MNNKNNQLDKLELLYETVLREENKYYDLAYTSLEKNSVYSMQMMQAQASAFQRVRYMIEKLIEEGKNGENKIKL